MKKSALIFLAISCITALVLLSSNNGTSNKELFEQWKNEHRMIQGASQEQEDYRFKIFENNLKEINEHNSKLGKSFEMGINKFTGLTKEEFKSFYLSQYASQINYNPAMDANTPSVKLNVDWVTYGAVSPVKNEGTCKANYAFSTVGAIQGISVIFFHTQMEYSAQQIVDCSSSFGNQGCTGGNMVSSFNFIKSRGINTEASYPYQAKLQTCKTSSGFFKISSYSNVTSCSALDMALTGRPISVAVDGNNFINYKSGVFDQCGTNLSLGALLVGGTDLYYKLKLSWGIYFGENGYIRLLKSNNICGICQAASYPIA